MGGGTEAGGVFRTWPCEELTGEPLSALGHVGC